MLLVETILNDNNVADLSQQFLDEKCKDMDYKLGLVIKYRKNHYYVELKTTDKTPDQFYTKEFGYLDHESNHPILQIKQLGKAVAIDMTIKEKCDAQKKTIAQRNEDKKKDYEQKLKEVLSSLIKITPREYELLKKEIKTATNNLSQMKIKLRAMQMCLKQQSDNENESD